VLEHTNGDLLESYNYNPPLYKPSNILRVDLGFFAILGENSVSLISNSGTVMWKLEGEFTALDVKMAGKKYYLCGYIHDETSGQKRGWGAHLDAFGKLEWDFVFPENSAITSLVVDENDCVYWSGVLTDTANVITKTSPDKQVVWRRQFPFLWTDRFLSLQVDEDDLTIFSLTSDAGSEPWDICRLYFHPETLLPLDDCPSLNFEEMSKTVAWSPKKVWDFETSYPAKFPLNSANVFQTSIIGDPAAIHEAAESNFCP